MSDPNRTHPTKPPSAQRRRTPSPPKKPRKPLPTPPDRTPRADAGPDTGSNPGVGPAPSPATVPGPRAAPTPWQHAPSHQNPVLSRPALSVSTHRPARNIRVGNDPNDNNTATRRPPPSSQGRTVGVWPASIGEPLPAEIDLGTLGPDQTGQLAAELLPSHQAKADDLIDEVKRAGLGRMKTADVIAMINNVGRIVDWGGTKAPVDSTALELRLAERYSQGVRARDALARVLGAPDASHVTTAQARSLAASLRRDPRLVTYLRHRKIAVKFGSRLASKSGEGMFTGNTIHMGELRSVRPDNFVRFFLHEAGHATFQRLVVPHNEEDKIPEVMRAGTVPSRYAGLRDQLSTMKPSDPEYGTVRAAFLTARQDMAEAKAATIWKSWPPDARRLYNAWLELRTNNGQHLLGIDLEVGKDPEFRRGYQAGGFDEFCAENFMLYTTGQLERHVAKLRDDPGTPAAVDAAWAETLAILDEYAGRQILGGNPT
jgi:hypothetical protein